jgi:hypothetical protein
MSLQSFDLTLSLIFKMAPADTPSGAKPPGAYLEYTDHGDIFTTHRFPEHVVDLGEIRMNYGVAGSASNPALLMMPWSSFPDLTKCLLWTSVDKVARRGLQDATA